MELFKKLLIFQEGTFEVIFWEMAFSSPKIKKVFRTFQERTCKA